jgi:glycosyltransferase involved in cell wall biosynthesis
MPLLTIAFPSYREPPQSLWATLTGAAMQAERYGDEIELLALDNAPESDEGKIIAKWCQETKTARYEAYGERVGTAITRDECYRRASGEFVLVADAHIQFFPGALDAAMAWINANRESTALVHGPLYWLGSKQPTDYATELSCSWGSDGMKGQWVQRPGPLPSEPFPIYAHGMGLSLSRRDVWPWSCKNETETMRGFGGEEGHLAELFRMQKRPILCHPMLKWAHCFLRMPGAAPYPNRWWDRCRNSILWTMRLGTWERDRAKIDWIYTISHEGKQPHLTRDEFEALAADPVGMVEPQPVPTIDAKGTPGTLFKGMLLAIGIKAEAGCRCEEYAALMDSWGVELCRQRVPMIVGWLRQEAERRKVPMIGFNAIANAAVKAALAMA